MTTQQLSLYRYVICFFFSLFFGELLCIDQPLFSGSNSCDLVFHVCLVNLQEILWRVTGDEVEVLDKILMYVSSVGNAGDAATNLQKWVVMRLKMDGFEASLCKTSRRTATGGIFPCFQFS